MELCTIILWLAGTDIIVSGRRATDCSPTKITVQQRLYIIYTQYLVWCSCTLRVCCIIVTLEIVCMRTMRMIITEHCLLLLTYYTFNFPRMDLVGSYCGYLLQPCNWGNEGYKTPAPPAVEQDADAFWKKTHGVASLLGKLSNYDCPSSISSTVKRIIPFCRLLCHWCHSWYSKAGCDVVWWLFF